MELITQEEINLILALSQHEELPISLPIRDPNESFGEFILKGSKALCKEHPDLVKRLL